MSYIEHAQARADIGDLVATQELAARPPRLPDHAAENRAMAVLALELARHPEKVAARLAEQLRELCRCGAAGAGLPAQAQPGVDWCAMAAGGVVLLRDPARLFPSLGGGAAEMLLAPWAIEGEPGGAVWVASHDPARRFDIEDARLLRALAGFAAAAQRAEDMVDAQARLADESAQRAAAERELRESDHRKDEFLATLAHELRNPLAPISNAVHLLRRPDGRRTADRMVEMVGRQVAQMVRLVDDLMDVSRITQGKLELRREQLALAEVLSMAVETSMPSIEAGRHELTVSLPEETLMLDADRVRLTQVFGNMLNNAAKYTDRGGRIWVSAWRDGAWAAVSVRDSGIGIPAAKLPHVFEMFSQAHRDSVRGQVGLGIGLTMVRSLVELHGGSVEARSEGPGRGSEFIVRLPLAQAAPPAPDGDDGGAGDDAPLENRRVLVIDDNGDAAESLALLLQAAGAEVHTARDGPAGLEAVRRFTPQAVLLDLGMPGMDGFEVARRLRAAPDNARLVLVALTGWGQEEDRRRTRSSGFDHHLTKPVDVDLLLDILARIPVAG